MCECQPVLNLSSVKARASRAARAVTTLEVGAGTESSASSSFSSDTSILTSHASASLESGEDSEIQP